MSAIIAFLASVFCLHGVTASLHAGDKKPAEGLWSGTWGGGSSADGVVYQPVIARMFVKGNQVELTGFPKVDDLLGTIRFDADTSRMTVIPTEDSAKVIAYKCKFRGNEVTLTDADGFAFTLRRKLIPGDNVSQLEFRQDGEDLVVTAYVATGVSPYVLWTHAETDRNTIYMGPPVGDLPLGKPQVALYYYVFQARDDPAKWNSDKRVQQIKLTWRLAGHRKSDEVYRVRREFVPSQRELEELMPQLKKLANDVRERQVKERPPVP
jgi:hypothetical protein